MKITTTLLSSLLLATVAQGQGISLDMDGGAIGRDLDIKVEGGLGKGFLLLMSTQYQTTPLPAPHIPTIDIGLELAATSITIPGFVGLTPASLSLPIPNLVALHGVTLNFQALEITNAKFSAKSNPWRLTFSRVQKTTEVLNHSNFKRAFGTASALDDGTVLLAGGAPVILPNSSEAAIFSDTTGSSGAEIYDHSIQSFEVVANMKHARSRHQATRLNDGRVLITGGTNGLQALASAEVYDPATRTFQLVAEMSHGRVGHTQTLLADGRVWVVGGSTFGSNQAVIAANAQNTTELFDPTTNTFVAGPSIGFNRSFHTATQVADGRVILAGGFSSSGGNNFVLNSVMSYTPDAGIGKVLNLANLPVPRVGHNTLLLANGKMMVVGGMKGIFADALAEDESIVFDPIQNATGLSGAMGTKTAFPLVGQLEGGDVLMAGGVQGVGTFEAPLHINNLLDKTPSGGGLWQSTGNFAIGRYGSSSAMLPDGRFAVFNGLFFNNILLDSAETYQP